MQDRAVAAEGNEQIRTPQLLGQGLTFSPIRGPEGNIEYLGYLVKGEGQMPELDLKALVEQSHQTLKEGQEGETP